MYVSSGPKHDWRWSFSEVEYVKVNADTLIGLPQKGLMLNKIILAKIMPTGRNWLSKINPTSALKKVAKKKKSINKQNFKLYNDK